MPNYFTLLTKAGLAAVTNAQLTNNKVEITNVAVGDANGTPYQPTGTEMTLRREVWRGGVSSVEIDSQNPNWIVVEGIIPSTVGGFSIREVGLYDTNGTLIAIGNYPDTYKPLLSDGSTMDLSLRTIIEVNNASSVTLRLDPNVVVASRKYVDDTLAGITTRLDKTDEKIAGLVNARQFGVIPNNIAGNSASLQAMIDNLRQVTILSNLTQQHTVNIESGVYILDAEVKMSPYVKLKAYGKVEFIVTHNGTGIWIAPENDDPVFQNTPDVNASLRKNSWNRGNYFDGSNGTFVFTSTLDYKQSTTKTIAIELGSREYVNVRNPISRYSIQHVNIYGFDTSFKFNTDNHYLGNFDYIHSELCNHHIVWGNEGQAVNDSGENFLIRNGILAGAEKEGVLLNANGLTITFENTSFDFNMSPIFKLKESGTAIRMDNCYVEEIKGDQLLLEIVPFSTGSANGRSSFYATNLIMLMRDNKKMFKNHAHAVSGNRMNVQLNLGGMEVRHINRGPNKLTDVELVDMSENFAIFNKNLLINTDQRDILSRGLTIAPNGDFSRSVVGTVLNATNDTYWQVDRTNNLLATVLENGENGSKSIDVTISDTSVQQQYIRIRSKFKLNANAGQIVTIMPSIKMNDSVPVSSNFYVECRVHCYDENDLLLTSTHFTGFYAATGESVEVNEYSYPRLIPRIVLPKGTTKFEPEIVVLTRQGNPQKNYSINDILVLITG